MKPKSQGLEDKMKGLGDLIQKGREAVSSTFWPMGDERWDGAGRQISSVFTA